VHDTHASQQSSSFPSPIDMWAWAIRIGAMGARVLLNFRVAMASPGTTQGAVGRVDRRAWCWRSAPRGRGHRLTTGPCRDGRRARSAGAPRRPGRERDRSRANTQRTPTGVASGRVKVRRFLRWSRWEATVLEARVLLFV